MLRRVWTILLLMGFPWCSSLAQGKEARSFNDVLKELLNEFSYELKVKKVPDLGAVSIRKVEQSRVIPTSYKSYLESLVAEKVKKFSSSRIVWCTPCRGVSTVVKDNRLHVHKNNERRENLTRFAKELSIDSWLDVSLLYQETNMVLAFNAFDSKTSTLLWSRVYNSEDIYRRKENPELAKQIEDEKKRALGEDIEGGDEEEASHWVFAFALGWESIANVENNTSMLLFEFMGAERFNQGTSEFGAKVGVLLDPGMLIPNYPGLTEEESSESSLKVKDTEKVIPPFTTALNFFVVYQYNFFTPPENYDTFRTGLNFGAGATIASGYLALGLTSGVILRFGRHFHVGGNLSYSFPGEVKVTDSLRLETSGGVGGGVKFGIQF